jgi:hypothetical protein
MSTEAQKQPKAWAYDIEVYPNLFSATFIHLNSDEERRFIIFHDFRDSNLSINHFNEFLQFMDTEVKTLVGYNNHGYDDIIVKHLMETRSFLKAASPKDITASCKSLNDKIINEQNRDQNGERRTLDPYIDSLMKRKLFGTLDLLLLFNTINRVGLKQIAINLRWPEIIDLPHPPSHIVVREEVNEIMYYNSNDVKITKRLFEDRKEVIQYRREYSAEFNTNVVNSNDTTIAKVILRKAYSEVTGLKYEEYRDKRTFRGYLQLGSCVAGKIYFISENYNKALNAFRNAKPVNTSKIDDEINDSADNKSAKVQPYKVDAEGRIILGEQVKDKKSKQKQFEYILDTKYLSHTLGLGGIHSNNPPEIIDEDSEYDLWDIDVESYYPRILINEKLYPKHLGPEFVKVYEHKLFYPRIRAKQEGKEAYQQMLKIALNSTFGLTKSAYSWLYDPKVTLSITISGQLYLMMLMERLELFTGVSLCIQIRMV